MAAGKRPPGKAGGKAAVKGKGSKSSRATAKAQAEPLEPWDRQAGEGAAAFAAFTTYRDLAPDERSIRKVGRIRAKAGSQVSEWSSRWRWVERSKAWDVHQDRIRQRELEAEQIEAARRHARTVARSITATDRIVEAFLAKIAGDGKKAQKVLEALSPEQLATLAIQASRVQPRLIPAERLSLGLSTTNVAGHDGGPQADPDEGMKPRSDDELRAFLTGADTARAMAEEEPVE